MSNRGRGEGSVYRRASDGRWVGMVDLGRCPDGKRCRRVVYGESRRQVADALKALLHDQQRGALPAGPRQTTGAWLELWLATWVKPRLRPKTFLSYEWLIRRHAIPRIGAIRLDKLTPEHIQRMLTAASADGLSPRSCHHLRAVLRTALNRAIRAGNISRNAAALADAPRVARPQRVFLDQVAARRLLQACEGHPDEALYRVALALGLRQGEALGLRWSDVDLDAGRLNVTHALQLVRRERIKKGENRWQPQLVAPKSEDSKRTLILPMPSADALRSHKARQTEDRLAKGHKWQELDLVFCNGYGLPLDGSAVTKRFQKLLAEAELPKMRFHDLRHSCASLLLAQGVPLKSIQGVLGHSTYALTADTYSHLVDDLKQQAAEAMARALGG